MRYVSLFSGVEAATVAWSRLGWEPLAFAEVDEFPSAVLAQRFPNVPNLGDVCNIDWKEFHEQHGAIDVLIGGSPCQSFSVAGGREGLKGESKLMFEYVRAVRDLVRASGGASPRYIVWENVPGCLSSNKGRDFGCLLDELENCGYFVCWRTLDSQFARVFDRASGRFAGPVPQRRRRVYLVGSLGGPSAADILFERQSMLGDHPKGREAREALAERLEVGAGMGDCARAGITTQDGDDVSRTITARMDSSPSIKGRGPSVIAQQIAGFKYHQGGKARGVGYELNQSPMLTTDYHQPAIMFRGDATPKFSEDVSITLRVGGDSGTLDAIALQSDGSSSNGSQNGCGYNVDGSAYTLNGRDRQAVCLQGSMIGREDKNGPQGNGVNDGVSFTLNTIDRHAVAFAQNTRDEVRVLQGDGQVIGALAAQPGMKQTSYIMETHTLAFDTTNITSPQNGNNPKWDEECHTLSAKSHPPTVICLESAQERAVMETDQAPTLNASYEQPIICAVDDNANAAVDQDLCGSLKVGGGSVVCSDEPYVLSNGDEVIGALCSCDSKWVQNQQVNQGKIICRKRTC